LEVKFAKEQVLILPDRAEMAERQFVEMPAERVPLSELLSREALDELAASETEPAPAKVTKEDGAALALANAPADAELQLARTTTPRKSTTVTSVASSAARAPLLERGLRTGPSFDGNAPPRYPEVARRNRWEGQVLLKLFISAEGQVTGVEVIRSSGHAILDAAAATAVRSWRGTPAMIDGEPVAAEEALPVRFRLR
jgi:protein TonB